MSFSLVTILGYCLAVVAGVVATFYRHKSLEYLALFQNAGAQLKGALATNQDLSSQVAIGEEKVKRAEKEAAKILSALHSSQSQIDGDAHRFKEKNQMITEKLMIAERENAHLNEQIVAFKKQLVEQQKSKKAVYEDVEKEFVAKLSTADKKMEEMRAFHRGFKEEVINANKRVKKLAWKNKQLEEKLQEVKFHENEELKAKVRRLEQLYLSMKGLREMSEERNQNWETALVALCQHILGRTHDTVKKEESIGTLVGSALEALGAVLVADDYSIRRQSHPGSEKHGLSESI